MTRPTTLAIAIALNLATFAARERAYGEEEDVCRAYAAKFSVIFKTLTDRDLNPFYQDKVYWHCANVEAPPPDLTSLDKVPPSPGQTESPAAAPGKPASAWEETCARRYKTWDPGTQTVIRYRTHTRVRCPVKG